jgi:hypothetical protein
MTIHLKCSWPLDAMAELSEDLDGMRITEVNQREEGWTFLVEVGHGDDLAEFFVDVDKEYWTRLTTRRIEPAELVRVTFEFLLDKEPKEVILKKFNVSDVSGYFPNYENEIRRLV